jgi:hypothetical protein
LVHEKKIKTDMKKTKAEIESKKKSETDDKKRETEIENKKETNPSYLQSGCRGA